MNQVYLLGAGFTRAVVGDTAPLTHELMAKLDISDFTEIHEEYERTLPDIEQFLSLLDLKVTHFHQINNPLSDRLKIIREAIVQQIIKQVNTTHLSEDNLNKYSLLKNFIDTVPCGACIMTLNYDCVLDQGLYLSGRWSPIGGYGDPLYSSKNENDNNSKDRILLLKLHGSSNFTESESGQEYFEIEISNHIFPKINLNTKNRQSSPHVLIMSYIKQFHNGIMYLWRKAIYFLQKADKLIIVGCSLREEDTFLRFALYHFGSNANTRRSFIDVIDMGEDNCNKIKEKILKLVEYPKNQQVNTFPGGLSSYLNRT
jgi:hypothetical protein